MWPALALIHVSVVAVELGATRPEVSPHGDSRNGFQRAVEVGDILQLTTIIDKAAKNQNAKCERCSSRRCLRMER